MRKTVAVTIGISLFSSAAVGQVRPQDCLPVFPVVDQVAAVPQDIIAEPVAPVAAASRRALFGLPLLLPLLALAGGAAIIAAEGGGGGGRGPISPA